MNTITPKELSTKMKSDDICILDVRSVEKFEKERIEHADTQSINIPKNHIFNIEEEGIEPLSVLPKDKEIVVTCTTGNSAGKCTKILAEKGYNVTLLEGGITSWKEYHNK